MPSSLRRQVASVAFAGAFLSVASSARREECAAGADTFSTLQAKNVVPSKPASVSLAERHASQVAHGCYDYAGWTDSESFTCMDYQEKFWCEADGEMGKGWSERWGTFKDFARNGDSALQACCFCGGGSHTEKHPPAPYPPDCRDLVPGWEDSDGYTCAQYEEKQWCTANGGPGRMWKSALWGPLRRYKNLEWSASEACCACGGGDALILPTPPKPPPGPPPTPAWACGTKAHYCHHTCMALGNSQPVCRRFCEDQFDDISHVFQGYCEKGVCSGKVKKPSEQCGTQKEYCHSICNVFTQYEGQPTGFCKLQCNMHFCELKKYWGQYCSAGLCK